MAKPASHANDWSPAHAPGQAAVPNVARVDGTQSNRLDLVRSRIAQGQGRMPPVA
jgi:hypothetical protein